MVLMIYTWRYIFVLEECEGDPLFRAFGSIHHKKVYGIFYSYAQAGLVPKKKSKNSLISVPWYFRYYSGTLRPAGFWIYECKINNNCHASQVSLNMLVNLYPNRSGLNCSLQSHLKHTNHWPASAAWRSRLTSKCWLGSAATIR